MFTLLIVLAVLTSPLWAFMLAGVIVGYAGGKFRVPFIYNCPVSKLWHQFATDWPLARMFFGMGILEGKKQKWTKGN